MDWIKFTIWLGLTFILYGLIASGLTVASTFVNIISVIGIIIWIIISVKTKCFQNRFKNEKNY